MHSYGVKKPFDHKMEHIKKIQSSGNMRYYPINPKGNVDEWGAIIKKQVEAAQKVDEVVKFERNRYLKQYGKGLYEEQLA